MLAYAGQSDRLYIGELLVAYRPIPDEKFWPEHEHVSKRARSQGQLHSSLHYNIRTMFYAIIRDSFSRHNRGDTC